MDTQYIQVGIFPCLVIIETMYLVLEDLLEIRPSPLLISRCHDSIWEVGRRSLGDGDGLWHVRTIICICSSEELRTSYPSEEPYGPPVDPNVPTHQRTRTAPSVECPPFRWVVL